LHDFNLQTKISFDFVISSYRIKLNFGWGIINYI